jgi:hypothetical protein
MHWLVLVTTDGHPQHWKVLGLWDAPNALKAAESAIASGNTMPRDTISVFSADGCYTTLVAAPYRPRPRPLILPADRTQAPDVGDPDEPEITEPPPDFARHHLRLIRGGKTQTVVDPTGRG